MDKLTITRLSQKIFQCRNVVKLTDGYFLGKKSSTCSLNQTILPWSSFIFKIHKAKHSFYFCMFVLIKINAHILKIHANVTVMCTLSIVLICDDVYDTLCFIHWYKARSTLTPKSCNIWQAAI